MPDLKGTRGENNSPRPSAEEQAPLKPALIKEIERRIAEKGKITFAEFMELALYWREGGYYTSQPGVWGRGGDYITSLDVSPIFSKIIAKQIHEMWAILGRPGEFELVEAGAGRGILSKGILDTIQAHYPELFEIIKIRLIEKNPNLREKAAGRITWHESLDELAPFCGCILSNELIDSFPVHRVIFIEGKLKEIYVGYDGSSFVDVIGEPSTDALERYFKDLGVELSDGHITEVNLAAKEWIRKAASLLKTGFVITIDYGYHGLELYAPHRKGSLLCHFRHTLNDNPYINIGSQDITTHIDFTTLVREGQMSGLNLTGYTTQKDFLLGLGIHEELMEAGTDPKMAEHERINFNRAIARLIMPDGMGDIFKVLIQHRNLQKPALKGLSFRDISRYL
ncbi:MAG: SAM-dependent methyltransferase [Deltaproteobacteria bacterium]|nr:SAM-dependent methyltransferase [Deltaproteobacteria bacterium]